MIDSSKKRKLFIELIKFACLLKGTIIMIFVVITFCSRNLLKKKTKKE